MTSDPPARPSNAGLPSASAGSDPPAHRPKALVRTDNLAKLFPVRHGLLGRLAFVRAFDGVSVFVRRGETLGLVGESGCGKTTLGRAIVRLTEPTYGRVVYDGKDVLEMRPRELRAARRRMQVICQDPSSSLNPRMTVLDIVAEGIRVHRLASSRQEQRAKVSALVERVGLSPSVLCRHPHEMSVGERQRIGIARALAVDPEFIVCDEPVSALDAQSQERILDLLDDIQRERGIALLLIAHDLAVVRRMSHRIAVMYLGRIIETARTVDLFERRYHPYTRALFSAMPAEHATRKRLRVVLEGQAPSPLEPPSGCAFHPRCPRARKGRCDADLPQLDEIPGEAQRRVRCFFPGED